MKDFLRPFMKTSHLGKDYFNRDEYILIPFSNIFKNMNEVHLITILSLGEGNPIYDKYIPHIMNLGLIDMIRDELYDIVIQRTEKNFLPWLYYEEDRDIIDYEIFEKDFQYISDLSDFLLASHQTDISMIANRLLKESFTKKIYISDKNWNSTKIEYISKLYPTYVNKRIIALDDTVTEAIIEFPELTTIFIETTGELLNILENTDPKLLKGKMFYLSLSMIPFDTISGLVITGQENLFNNTFEKYGCYVDYFVPSCIPWGLLSWETENEEKKGTD